ncbi:MAG: hypothetical protein ACTSXX_01870 [Candidatus Baldrarchaeia archaeon]
MVRARISFCYLLHLVFSIMAAEISGLGACVIVYDLWREYCGLDGLIAERREKICLYLDKSSQMYFFIHLIVVVQPLEVIEMLREGRLDGILREQNSGKFTSVGTSKLQHDGRATCASKFIS